MSIDPELLDAKNAVEVKRAQLMHSVKYALGEAKRRLAPDLLAEQAWEKVKKKSGDAVHDAVFEAKAKPVLVGGIAAAIGLFLARKPIGRKVVEAYDKARGEHEPEAVPHAAKELPAAKPPPRRTRRPAAAPSVAEFHDVTKPIDEKKKKSGPDGSAKPAAAKKGAGKKKKTEDV